MAVERDEHGKVKGGSLRKEGTKKRARGLSRWLRSEMKKRHGDERAHYLWLMDIAANTQEKAADRVKAIDLLAKRMDGPPPQIIDLEISGPGGAPIQSEVETRAQTPTERLAALLHSAAVLARAGVGAAPERVGCAVGEPPAEHGGGVGGAGAGESAPE